MGKHLRTRYSAKEVTAVLERYLALNWCQEPFQQNESEARLIPA